MFDQATALDVMTRIQKRIREFDHARAEPTEVLEVVGDDDSVPVETRVVDVTTVTRSNLWHHPDAHPVAIDLILFRSYGPQFLEWETDMLRRVVAEDFRSSLSELNLAKIQAVKALHLVDTYWDDWEVFLWCSMALNGVFPNFAVMQAPTAAQCLVSVDIANHLRDDMPWSDEVKAFVEVSFRHDGVFRPVAPVNFITIQCEADLANFKDIDARWPKVRDTRTVPRGETIEDEQLRRMLTAHTYLEESRARLRHQLNLVDHA